MWPFIPGERFPYANFHAMNQDWILAVVKDFKDKYDHVEELITNGVTTITNTTNTELAHAVQEMETAKNVMLTALNTWYTTHQGYLDQELADNLASFNTQVEAKAQQTIASIPDDYSALAGEAIKGNYVWNAARLSTYPTANDLPVQSKYIGNFGASDYDNLNLPSRTLYALDPSAFLVETTGNNTLCVQIATFGHTSLKRQFIRMRSSGTWDNWELITNQCYVWNSSSAARYATADALPVQTTFIGNFAPAAYDPLHMPSRTIYSLDPSIFLVQTIGNSLFTIQVATFGHTNTAKQFIRTAISGSWNAWKQITGDNKYIIDKAGHGNNTSLVNGIIEAYEAGIKNIHVKAGNYNLITEYQARYGQTWETGLLNSNYAAGLPIGNDMHISFDPRAIVTFDYSSGRNTTINSEVSAFSAMDGDFEITGLTISCKNIRYCIHDERNGIGSYKHVYDNCKMSMIDDANTAWKSCQCIGGGLGKSGNIEIRNCDFYSDNNGDNAGVGAVSYHNGQPADIMSFISITGCFFNGNNGTVRASWYGLSTLVSKMLATNNSFKIAPIFRAETQDSNIQNIELTQFNNVIR